MCTTVHCNIIVGCCYRCNSVQSKKTHLQHSTWECGGGGGSCSCRRHQDLNGVTVMAWLWLNIIGQLITTQLWLCQAFCEAWMKQLMAIDVSKDKKRVCYHFSSADIMYSAQDMQVQNTHKVAWSKRETEVGIPNAKHRKTCDGCWKTNWSQALLKCFQWTCELWQTHNEVTLYPEHNTATVSGCQWWGSCVLLEGLFTYK